MMDRTQKQKLGRKTVKEAELRTSRYTIFDTEVRGFGLRVYPSGQMSWVLEYKSVEGGRRAPTRRITIGKAADPNGNADFTPEEARKLADKLRAQVKVGVDPQHEKAERRKAATVTELATSFLANHVGKKRAAVTHALYKDILDRLVLPEIGSRKAANVRRSDIASLHLGLAKTPFQANRVVAVIASMYSFGGKHGLTPEGHNPARGIDRFEEEGRERFLTGEELERLGAAIRTAEKVGAPWKINPAGKTKHVPKQNRQTPIGEHPAAAIRLLIFTGCRLREILHLKWTDIDFERGMLFLAKSKTGKKSVVLNAPALAVLQGITRVGSYVIAGESAGAANEKPRSDLKRPWSIVTVLAGLEGLRIHDLRHSFASFGAGGGMGLPIIGKLLGHTQAVTTQRYAHLATDPLRQASNTIGNQIAAAMGENSLTAEVIPMRKGKR